FCRAVVSHGCSTFPTSGKRSNRTSRKALPQQATMPSLKMLMTRQRSIQIQATSPRRNCLGKSYEEVRGAYVFWEDYREGPARKWIEVPWVRFRSYMTRDELLARFGKDKGAKVNLDF